MPDLGKRDIRFLSTLSLRRATTQMQAAFKGPEISIHALLAESDTDEVLTNDEQTISIHALLAESDNADTKTPHFTNYFYPRSPCGERLRKVPILGIK